MNLFLRILLIVIVAVLVISPKAKATSASTETASAKTESKTEKSVDKKEAKTVEKPVEYAESGIGMKAAPLKGLSWIKGKPVKLERGKTYVIEFWATWCGPCRTSIPHLTELQKRYKDKLVVIGVSTEPATTVKPFVEKMGSQMDYTVATDVKGFVKREYSDRFEQEGIPHAFIIDPYGRIAWVGHPLDGMDPMIEKVVKGDFDPIAYVKKLAEAEALQRQLYRWYQRYFETIQTQGPSEETTMVANSFIEKAPPQALHAMVRNILALPDKEKRQLDIAIKAARQCNKLTEGAEPIVLDALAAALFEDGRIAEAIDYQKKAVELAATNPPMQAELKKILEQYQAALEEK